MRTPRYIAIALLALCAALPATVHASPNRYANQLAHNAQQADMSGKCLVLRSIDLCGWRVRLVAQSVEISSNVDCLPRSCSFEWAGRTKGEPFFCEGYMAWHPRLKRWVADQAMDCYGDQDPSWGFTDDGSLFREPS